MFYSCNKQKEKDVKTHRRQLEKKWREEIIQLDQLREQEGHGKIELGVGHVLALGPPTDENQTGTDNDIIMVTDIMQFFSAGRLASPTQTLFGFVRRNSFLPGEGK